MEAAGETLRTRGSNGREVLGMTTAGPPVPASKARYARYAGAAACIVCGVYWWRWWQQSKLKRAAASSSMAIEELAFAWLAFSGTCDAERSFKSVDVTQAKDSLLCWGCFNACCAYTH